jgi:hypothetical protein
MRILRTLTHREIQYGLERGNKFAHYVIKSLGLNSSFTEKELSEKISQDLSNMNYIIKVYDSFSEKGGRKNPSFISLNDSDRKAGGVIMLNKQFPINYLRDALFHEYAHIKDEKLPIHTEDKNAFNSTITLERFYMKHIEFLADMDAYSLMMPIEKIKNQLLDNSYNIDEILEMYNGIEKSSVLKWIVINNHLPCHYMYIVFEKDSNDKFLQRIVYDNCFYDHQSDPVPFSVDTILANPDSAASIALQTRKSISKLSVINNMNMTPYYCYAYYEEDVSKEVIHNMFPYLEGDRYDRLLVIGWTKDYYDMILGYNKRISKSGK